MKLRKLFAVTLTAALSAYLLHAAKPDSEIQAKARAVLEQTEIPPAAQPATPPPAHRESRAGDLKPPVQVITAAPAPDSNPEAVAKARMQLRATMNQLDGQLAGWFDNWQPRRLKPGSLGESPRVAAPDDDSVGRAAWRDSSRSPVRLRRRSRHG